MEQTKRLYKTDYPEIMNLKDVCEFIGVGRKTALNFIKQNHIKHIKVGREYKVLKNSLTNFIEVN